MILTQPLFKARLGAVQTATTWATVEPFILAAERGFRERIGSPLFNYLEGLSDIEATDYQLRVLAEGAIAWASLFRALPHLKFRIGDLGLMKNSPANTIAITKWEYIDSKEAVQQEADDWLEDFFQLLESLRPAVWTASIGYQRRQAHFIRSTDELARFVSLGGGRNGRFFDMLVPYIAKVEELYISPVLTDSDFEDLLEKWKDPEASWSKEETKAIEYIQKVVAPMSYYEAFPYLPLQVDYKSFSSPRVKDGLVDEREPEANDVNTLKRQLFMDAELYTAKLKKHLDKVASSTLFPGYFDAYKKAAPVEKPDDFTDTPHVII
ncbi:DUF6712 family protein [Siphonobacter sp. SORGH_AS_0500]|uniref:DUF6712 family protein n=1 Tax=Siphonobacter sp. SORGH_AS_0500 TaxID=1864824 RepID=UPI0028624BD4|nr:DUF6712 family protein [Siphonobacter sp. SORGH_AS_0500]MDR6195930.1 hypothetical protein [Siphonobacter sp. SORGH_AS_0500]